MCYRKKSSLSLSIPLSSFPHSLCVSDDDQDNDDGEDEDDDDDNHEDDDDDDDARDFDSSFNTLLFVAIYVFIH